ncbi:MAG: deoxyribose-phosphate aldolase [Ruminococcaceae bacterium]|nr:deoxyribose-phosphate aldolase [Oscillospiraceae bacterium]
MNNELKNILSLADHTLLAQTSTWEQIKVICDDAVKYGTASVCIPPSFVKKAAEYLGGKMKVCTVIGFPNGYNTTAVKCFETTEAVENGADEIDMVINIGMVKEGRFDDVRSEIEKVKAACDGKLLKVIIETCLLTEDEKISLCKAVTDAGAEYIKTSTGFAGGGATREDVALLRKHVGSNVKVKAAGGIKTIDDAKDFVALGADRLGTSKLVAEAKKLEETEK